MTAEGAVVIASAGVSQAFPPLRQDRTNPLSLREDSTNPLSPRQDGNGAASAAE
jgi:hypothetical protein